MKEIVWIVKAGVLSIFYLRQQLNRFILSQLQRVLARPIEELNKNLQETKLPLLNPISDFIIFSFSSLKYIQKRKFSKCCWSANT